MVKVRQRRWLPQIHRVTVRDFSGGLNIHDTPFELADNETADCTNATVDSRGGIASRLGYRRTLLRGNTDLASLSATPSVLKAFLWASSVSTDPVLVAQVGRTVYIGTSLGWTTHTNLWSTTAPADYCVFNGKLLGVHPADGMKSLATQVSVSWTTISGSPKGNMIAPWEARVWVGDGGATVNGARLSYSAAGDEATWPATNYVDIFELDGDVLTALASIEGALLVFKQSSTYRVYDSATAAYTSIDAKVGCVGPRQVTQRENVVYPLAYTGLYETTGAGELKELTKKIRPIFDASIGVDVAGSVRTYKRYLYNLQQAALGWNEDRLCFSAAMGAAGANNIMFELDPKEGWIVPHSCAAAVFANLLAIQSAPWPLMGVAPGGVNVMDFFVGAKDNANRDDTGGSSIPWYWKTPPREFFPGHKVMMRSMILEGRGSISVGAGKDYAAASGTRLAACASSGHPSLAQPIYSWGAARAWSWELSATQSAVVALDAPSFGVPVEAGQHAVQALHLAYVPLGEN